MAEFTRILSRIEAGDPTASDQLLPLVYDELRRLAVARLAREKPGQTLQATALVHEAYLRLVGSGDEAVSWNGRAHFFGAAAEAMRRILVEKARQKLGIKGGGAFERIELSDIALRDAEAVLDLWDLNEALQRFEQEEPQKAELVKLRFFAGLPLEEAAELLGISAATAKRYWSYSRAWLFGQLHRE